MRSIPRAFGTLAAIVAITALLGACTKEENKAFCDKADKASEQIDKLSMETQEDMDTLVSIVRDLQAIAPPGVKSDMDGFVTAMDAMLAGAESGDMDVIDAESEKIDTYGENIDKFIKDECGFNFSAG